MRLARPRKRHATVPEVRVVNLNFLYAELVVENCQNQSQSPNVNSTGSANWERGARIREPWLLPADVWDFNDHLCFNEQTIVGCTGTTRLRLTAPAAVDATFHVLNSTDFPTTEAKTDKAVHRATGDEEDPNAVSAALSLIAASLRSRCVACELVI
jgi:hypothetical protein